MDYQGPTAAVRASAATAAVPASVGSSRLAQMQMRFQQRQQQERDQRKIEQIATRATASTTTIAASSSNGRITSTTTNVATATATVTANSSATSGGGAVELADRLNATTLSSSLGAGKVRQMFDDRRHGRVAAGIDKSYPLQPIQTKTVATGAATSAGITNGNHSTSGGGGGGGSNNNSLAGGGVGDACRDLGRSVVTKGATGMNNKPRVPPISATSRNRLVQQQSNRAHSLRQDVVSGMQQQQSTRSTSNAGETTTDYGGFDDNDNFLELEKHPDIAFDLDGDSVHAAVNHVNNNIGGDYSLSSSNAVRTATNVNSLKLKPVPGRSAASLTATPARNSSLKKQASSITSNGSITSTATLPRSVNGSAKLGIQRAAPGSKSNGPSRGVSQPSPSSSAGSLRRISSTPAPTTGMAMHATTVAHHNNDDLVPDGLTRCEICSRNFADDRIEKHRQICQKTKAKKRKVFDVTKHRVQGTDAESYVLVKGKKGATGPSRKQSSQLNGSGTQAGTGAGKQSNWRKKHEEFIATIRAAKELKAHLAKGGKLSDLPPPPPAENPDYVQCPHCSRRFNQAAADRHIPKCATMLHNKPKPKPKGAASTLRRY
ncbi:pneumococcal serine-rich repeat protein [Anopheles bellator]|uniref:pneumococcal serine-rich repeat protein n=1 Tax=Anopheles bellator TaxID=139047 RepID=UPI002647A53F|nr:pneumococcal serine-rich repeat protein [Anopheles bellator]